MKNRFVWPAVFLAALVINTSCEKEVLRTQSSEATDQPLVEKTIRVGEPESSPTSLEPIGELNKSQTRGDTCMQIPGTDGSFSFFPASDHPCSRSADEIQEGSYELVDIAVWASAEDLGVKSVTWLHQVNEAGKPVEEDPSNYHASFTAEGMSETAVRFPIRLPASIEKTTQALSFREPYLYDARVASVDQVAQVDRLIIVGPDANEGAKFYEILTDGDLVKGNLYKGDFNYDRIFADDIVLYESPQNTGQAIMLQQTDGQLVVFSDYSSIDSIDSPTKAVVRVRLIYRKV